MTELRCIGDEFDCCVFTGIQTSANSKDLIRSGESLQDSELASSKGQARPLDFLMFMSQNETEALANVGTLEVAKNREGVSKFRVRYYRDPQNLQMREIDNNEYKNRIMDAKKSIENTMKDKDILEKATEMTSYSFKSNRG